MPIPSDVPLALFRAALRSNTALYGEDCQNNHMRAWSVHEWDRYDKSMDEVEAKTIEWYKLIYLDSDDEYNDQATFDYEVAKKCEKREARKAVVKKAKRRRRLFIRMGVEDVLMRTASGCRAHGIGDMCAICFEPFVSKLVVKEVAQTSCGHVRRRPNDR